MGCRIDKSCSYISCLLLKGTAMHEQALSLLLLDISHALHRASYTRLG
jgi:hypothetical protein